MTKMVLLTGASGFVGSATLKALLNSSKCVIAPTRAPLGVTHPLLQNPLISSIEELKEAQNLLSGCHAVIHIAAKAHTSGVSLSEYRRVNTEATLNLANAAVAAGVERFIFISSIGVNGISNTSPFSNLHQPAPLEDYAVSKFDAEIGLQQISAKTGLEVVIIRPPLVYGPNAPGNFGKLAKLVRKNLPLPLGAIHNKRSLVALDNLVDLIVTCIAHPAAANQTFLVSDDQDVSTSELLAMMTKAAGKTPRLLPVPVSWLKLAAKLTGKSAVIDRLCGNLQVDISHTKHTLGWQPVITLADAIKKCF